jgi:hypothetical protein
LRLILFSGLAALLTGCGGGNSSSSSTPSGPPSGIANRAYVTVQAVAFGGANGQIAIINASADATCAKPPCGVGGSTIPLGQAPTRMVLSPDKSKLLMLDPRGHQIFTIDNKKENELASLPLADAPTSAVILSDNKTGYAAVRNINQVVAYDITTGNSSAFLIVLEPRTLVVNHTANKILVFSDDTNVMNVIDTATNTLTAVSDPGGVLSRPVFGIFSNDDSKAFIVSCGPECGGAPGTANVAVLNMATLTVSAGTPVSAGTIALLDTSGNLFVAGTTAAGVGRLDVVNTNASPMIVSNSVVISDGLHDAIGLGSNNLLFVGAQTCNNVVTGCLAMYNTSTHAVKIETPKGNVTGIEAIKNRNVVYVIEGGELVIYDTTTSAPQATQIDLVGTAFDVKAVDQ